MATKIPPGRARFRIGGVTVPLWLPTRAERIALDIARQKNAEFLAKQSAPLVSDSTIDSLKRIAAEDAELLAKREATTQVLTDAEMVALLRDAWKTPDVAGRPLATARAIEAAVLAKTAATPGATHGN